ncbi:MAG: GntR family transcriptional regulator [Tissierellia bacterium]|mgnify:CR=1 FL=1|jgi:GntR family transcriptional regulator|nr:GntR family transcriptional regulator [Bacillota bacterium]NLK59062.1 GntR family transcriptional regulator [Tissierellia bacterium]
MHIVIKNASDKPIYEQIKTQIKKEILDGRMKEGEQLPSIRLLAKELRISVITTKRAYDDLEQEGFIHSVQGKGSFVAPQNPILLREEHLKQIETRFREALELAALSGITNEELHEMLDLLQEEENA